MDGVEPKIMQNPTFKTHKYSLAAQICLRILATVASLAAAWIMFTNKQSIILYGLVVDARNSYSSAFKFFAVANLITSVFSVGSLFVAVILARNWPHLNNYFYMFLHDLVLMTLVIAACGAATSIGFVGRYGNNHAGWMPICDNFVRFCDRVTISLILSYFSFLFYLFLTIISANKSRKIQV
ncbi:CASP-like protein 1F1 [Camellia lanceoleosa]|uniref:CASP-like protein 1F1 n=1 Tax=Camellia lanceoleosa TaxID=1840588 RepID=A0ACC0FBZ6_9ERIC|nr:CASP-like protein 1F1 [Camellia lanceoleosa]